MKQIISAQSAAELIKDGSSIMIAGFLKCGTPTEVIDKILEQSTKDLTIICNDTSFADSDRGKLISNKRVKKAIVAHIGTNPETGRQMHDKELEVELVPMGTLVERIHAYGAGLGGVLTPTGVGTLVEEGKEIIERNGKKYLFEEPLGADFALIYGSKVDSFGNVFIHGTARNHNLNMATAAKTVIVEAEEYLDFPLDPDMVTIPNVFVDYIVKKGA
ncbi:MAG: CoA transferase subunit A [Alphaproteobacteria bacterium]